MIVPVASSRPKMRFPPATCVQLVDFKVRRSRLSASRVQLGKKRPHQGLLSALTVKLDRSTMCPKVRPARFATLGNISLSLGEEIALLVQLGPFKTYLGKLNVCHVYRERSKTRLEILLVVIAPGGCSCPSQDKMLACSVKLESITAEKEETNAPIALLGS